MMECVACSRNERHFYCSSCLKSRLVDHQARKQQLRNALTLQSNRASNLLLHGPASTIQPPSTRSRPFGIREESELKAQRWTLSVKLRDTRNANEHEKSKVEILTSDVAKRKAALDARRTNLSTARSLLTSLASPSHPTSPSLPFSLSSLTSEISRVERSFASVSDSLAKVRRILTLELLTTYSFKSIESPLPDPFILNPSNPAPSTPFAPTFGLANLPLPPLSLLPTLPSQTLEALLVNLCHLTRLIALYEGVSLPFVPLPNCYGPGRAGIKSSPGCSGWDGIVESRQETSLTQARDDPYEEELAETVTACFPLGFGIEKSKSAKNGPVVEDEGATGSESTAREDGSRGGGDSRSAAKTRVGSNISSKRSKLVVKGAIALAYDLGYICWIRETRKNRAREWHLDDLDDLGYLISRAAGAESESERREGRQSHTDRQLPLVDDLDPFPPASQSTASVATIQPQSTSEPALPTTFPLSFSAAARHYLTAAFPPSASGLDGGKKRRKNGTSTIGRGTRLGESSFVDAGVSIGNVGEDLDEVEVDDGADDDEDEEWDLI